MNKERLQEIKDSIDFQREFLISSNMQTLCVDEEMELYNEIIRLQQENQQLKQWDKNKDTRNSRQRIANAILMKKNKRLENNRDKAIEEIKYLIGNCDIVDYQGEKIMNILKGDSDE